LNKLGDAGGHKGNAKPTQDEPIFESRAVYNLKNNKNRFSLRHQPHLCDGAAIAANRVII
jgi:hypothetical protein